jgi:hypothetical protein
LSSLRHDNSHQGDTLPTLHERSRRRPRLGESVVPRAMAKQLRFAADS